jgi:hypothetical protein
VVMRKDQTSSTASQGCLDDAPGIHCGPVGGPLL